MTMNIKKWFEKTTLQTISLLKKREVHQIIKLDVLFLLRKILWLLLSIGGIALFLTLEYTFQQKILDTHSVFGMKLIDNQVESVASFIRLLMVITHVVFVYLIMILVFVEESSKGLESIRGAFNVLKVIYFVVGLTFYSEVSTLFNHNHLFLIIGYTWLGYRLIRLIETWYLKRIVSEIVNGLEKKVYFTSNVEQIISQEKNIFHLQENWNSFVKAVSNECAVRKVYFNNYDDFTWENRSGQAIRWKVSYFIKCTFHEFAINPWIAYLSPEDFVKEVQIREKNGETLHFIDDDTFYVEKEVTMSKLKKFCKWIYSWKGSLS